MTKNAWKIWKIKRNEKKYVEYMKEKSNDKECPKYMKYVEKVITKNTWKI